MSTIEPSLIDTRIGEYRVVRQIGAGGMGAVFEALHETIGRRVAIKVLHAQHSRDAQIAGRFLNEARAVQIIDHPGIVQISEYGRLADGSAYIVMELLKGQSLSDRLEERGGRLALAETLRLSRQVASTLVTAHEKGIVHRDLKPANVMIVPDPELPGGERAKVLDFGIAKVAAASGGAHPIQRTQTGLLLGTPLYMSPEQCRGAGQVDSLADVYSLGVMLYQMLCGEPPFVAEGVGALVGMHLYEVPPPLAQRCPDLDPDLVALVHAMLEKDRERRPTMAQVADELAVLLPPGAGSGPQPQRVRRSHSAQAFASTLSQATGQAPAVEGKRPALMKGAAALGVVLALGGGLLVLRSAQKPAATDRTIAGATGVTAGAGPSIGPSVPAAPARPGPPPAPLVRWEVRSDPPGAEVVDGSGQVLGTTPYSATRSPGPGTVSLNLRRPGYRPKPIVLSLGADMLTEVKLEPEEDRPRPPERRPGPGKKDLPAAPGKKDPAPAPGAKERKDLPATPAKRPAIEVVD